jgi:hypothetical protein
LKPRICFSLVLWRAFQLPVLAFSQRNLCREINSFFEE